MMSAALPDDSRVLEEFGVAKRKISEIFNEIDQQMEAVQVFLRFFALFGNFFRLFSSRYSARILILRWKRTP